MDDALLVQMLDGPGDRRHQPDGRGDVDRPLGDPLGQALTLDVLHGEEVLPVELAHLVDVDDVRVAEPGGGLGLGLEPPDVLRREPRWLARIILTATVRSRAFCRAL